MPGRAFLDRIIIDRQGHSLHVYLLRHDSFGLLGVPGWRGARMPVFSLARPFENLQSLAEMQAMALVNHLGTDLAAWREGRDLEQRKSSKEQQLEELQAQLSSVSEEADECGLQIEKAQELVRLTTFGAAGSGLLLIIGLIAGVVLLAFLGFALIVGALIVRAMQKKNGEAAVARLDQCRAEEATLNEDIAGGKAELKKIGEEIDSRADAYPEVSLAQVRLGVEVTKVGERTVMLDSVGFDEPARLQVLDPRPVKKKLKKIRPEIEKLKNVPAMLFVHDGKKYEDPVNNLYGEEDRISDLVDAFSTGLGDIEKIEIGLPLVEGGGTLAQRLNNGELDPVLPGDAIIVKGSGLSDQIDAFVDQLNDAKKDGSDVLSGIQEVSEGLSEICDRYSSARQDSINTLHANLLEVLGKAHWCNRRFYCPRTIMSPEYIQALIGINLADAHLLPIDDLLQRLRSEPEIARRMEGSPDLPEQLVAQHDAIRQISEQAGVVDTEVGISSSERARVFNDEEAELIKAFSLTLQKAMTGASQPLLVFSKESVLYFDPETEVWASRTSPYSYSTVDVSRYGSVVKVYSDLLVPLWENLWTEKADFRKSELFRTNEAIISMSEKEAEKLIDTANQFRADMRTVRENTNIFRSELTAKLQEVRDFRASLDAIGLLSEHLKTTLSDERIAALDVEGGDVASIDGFENILTYKPQTQAEARGTMHDPIDYVREPGIVIRPLPTTKRLALTGGDNNG